MCILFNGADNVDRMMSLLGNTFWLEDVRDIVWYPVFNASNRIFVFYNLCESTTASSFFIFFPPFSIFFFFFN